MKTELENIIFGKMRFKDDIKTNKTSTKWLKLKIKNQKNRD